MKVTENFIKTYDSFSKEDKQSTIYFVVYTCATLPFFDRLAVAVEIILGKRFCRWISK